VDGSALEFGLFQMTTIGLKGIFYGNMLSLIIFTIVMDLPELRISLTIPTVVKQNNNSLVMMKQ
jgi:hypothetical protein